MRRSHLLNIRILVLATLTFVGCSKPSAPSLDSIPAPANVTITYSPVSIQSTGLSNEIIGGPNSIRGAIRFRAAYSSPISSFRGYIIDHAVGYSGGTGGTLNVELYPELGGLPAEGLRLSHGAKVPDPQFSDPTTGRGRFPLIAFTMQPTLTRGSWYWIVITDADATPKTNYFSMDYLYNATVLNQVPDASVWISVGANGAGGVAGPWKPIPYLIPSPLVLHYANGLFQGLGWIAAVPTLQCGDAYGFLRGSCT